jgi:bisphosphoglycerate-independent phosphoglycerate mutase (AlkP superfamily)
MPKKMSSEEALAHSFNTEYPDALLQIIQLLESPRTGDLILSAGPGYDLRAKHENPEHRSSHGALFRDHMLVPLVMNAKVNKEFIRTVDIFPTILSFLGQPIPNNIDGISLID